MEKKKNDKVNIEKRKGLYFQLGLIIALSLCLLAFEWTSGTRGPNEFDTGSDKPLDEEAIPITEMEPPEPETPPEVPDVAEIFEIVEDDVQIENEILFADDDADIDTEIDMYDFKVEDETEDVEEVIFYVVEEMPSFKGGDVNKFREWVQKRVKYPTIASENGIQGKVYLNFVVEPDGKVTGVQVVRGVDPALDNEAIRVIGSSPKWVAGKQRGESVRVRFSLFINFQLQ